jgi:hypothetical protein
MRLVLLVFLAVSALGCAGKGAVEVAAPPLVERRQEEALAEGVEQVGVAQELAAQEQAVAPLRGPRWFVARYNRAPCDCPAYELWLRGAWVRHYPGEVGRLPQGEGLFLVKASLRVTRIKALNNNVYDSFEIQEVAPGGDASLAEALARMGGLR